MTQFSDRLKKYFDRRGMTVVALAKQLSIDRATLHKIISGERRPVSVELVENLSRLLLLSVDETNELMEMYKISVMGENVYRRRLRVKHMIERLSELDGRMIPVSGNGGLEAAPPIKVCFSHDELLRYVSPLLAESVRNGSGIKVLGQPGDKLKELQALCVAGEGLIEHIICFDNSTSDNSGGYNLEIFPDICEFAFCYSNYRPLCYYDNIAAHINSMTVLPVLLVTDDFAMCAEKDLGSGVVYKDPMAVRFYRREFDRLRDNCYSFLQVDKDFEQMLLRTNEYPKYTLTLDHQPSIVLALDDSQIRHMLSAGSDYINMVIKRGEMLKERFLGMGYINLFTESGLNEFLETGISDELSMPQFLAMPKDERLKVLRKMILLAENGDYEYRVVNDSYAPKGLRVSLLESSNVKLVSHLPDRSMAFVNVTEQSIVYAFNDYIGYLLAERLVYSREKSLDIMRCTLARYESE